VTRTEASHVVSIEEAARILGVGRSCAYSSVKAGEFPVPVIKVGRRLLVSRHRLEELLGMPENELSPAANPGSVKTTVNGSRDEDYRAS
jgi:excisionase family DNA binding protein